MLLDGLQPSGGLTASDVSQSNINENSSHNANVQNENYRQHQAFLIQKPHDNKIDQKINSNIDFQNNPDLLLNEGEICLSETSTLTVLHIPCCSVYNSEHAKHKLLQVKEQNEQYEKLLAKHVDAALFSTTESQTYNLPLKHRGTQATPTTLNDQGTQATKWNIFDAMNDQDIAKESTSPENELSLVENSSKLKIMLNLMECAVIQNFMAEKQMLYRMHTNDASSYQLSLF